MIRLSQNDHDVQLLNMEENGDRYLITYKHRGKENEMFLPKRVLEGRTKSEIERFLSEHLELSSVSTEDDKKKVGSDMYGPTTGLNQNAMRERMRMIENLSGYPVMDLGGDEIGFNIDIGYSHHAWFFFPHHSREPDDVTSGYGTFTYDILIGNAFEETGDPSFAPSAGTPDREAEWLKEMVVKLKRDIVINRGIDTELSSWDTETMRARIGMIASNARLDVTDEGADDIGIEVSLGNGDYAWFHFPPVESGYGPLQYNIMKNGVQEDGEIMPEPHGSLEEVKWISSKFEELRSARADDE